MNKLFVKEIYDHNGWKEINQFISIQEIQQIYINNIDTQVCTRENGDMNKELFNIYYEKYLTQDPVVKNTNIIEKKNYSEIKKMLQEIKRIKRVTMEISAPDYESKEKDYQLYVNVWDESDDYHDFLAMISITEKECVKYAKQIQKKIQDYLEYIIESCSNEDEERYVIDFKVI